MSLKESPVPGDDVGVNDLSALIVMHPTGWFGEEMESLAVYNAVLKL